MLAGVVIRLAAENLDGALLAVELELATIGATVELVLRAKLATIAIGATVKLVLGTMVVGNGLSSITARITARFSGTFDTSGVPTLAFHLYQWQYFDV
jgi:hypothetical protein